MKVVDFIVCEDIRTELGSKVSLMGVFDDAIEFALLERLDQPFAMRMAIFSRVRFEEQDTLPNRCLIVASHEATEILRIDGRLDIIDRSQMLRIPVPIPAFPLRGPGRLTFHMRMLRDDVEVGTHTHVVALSVVAAAAADGVIR